MERKKNTFSQSPQPATAGQSPSYRILVVDDEPFILQLNKIALIHCGYDVHTAEDGEVAWADLRINHYDLLITDNRMPKLSGLELLKKLHSADITMPVIMATGTFPAEEFARYPWLQPAATLQKPYATAELLEKVNDVLHVKVTPGSNH